MAGRLFNLKLNPITRKRLARFAALKRAYWSFWILVGLYVCSLLANLIANDKPLLIRFEGSFYFPIFAYTPDDVFTGSGLQTRPDFKDLAESPAFAETSGNFMLFAPVPYGPYEVIDASEVDADETVWVTLARDQRVASLDIAPDWTISRSLGFSAFYAIEDERTLRGQPAEDYLDVTDALRQTVEIRFANEAAVGEFQERIVLDNGIATDVSIAPQPLRGRPPRAVRVTLREALDRQVPDRMPLREQGLEGKGLIWQRLSDDSRQRIQELAEERMTRGVDPFRFSEGDDNFVATFDREDVRFPFRPTGEHWFGLDNAGRDVLARILYGLRISLNFGIALVAVTMVLGIVIGGFQGYHGGRVDLFGQRFTEIWEALPFLYIMILMGSVFGRSFMLLLLIYGAFNWIGMSYYMRGEFLKLRKQPFVEAAHCLGLPSWKIMLRHILPNALVPVITFFPFSLVGAIFALSALDFLGFGLPPPTPSWGEMLSQAQEFKYAWWLVLYPSLALFVVILLGVFIGEGIRAAFDPRVSSRYES